MASNTRVFRENVAKPLEFQTANEFLTGFDLDKGNIISDRIYNPKGIFYFLNLKNN